MYFKNVQWKIIVSVTTLYKLPTLISQNQFFDYVCFIGQPVLIGWNRNVYSTCKIYFFYRKSSKYNFFHLSRKRSFIERNGRNFQITHAWKMTKKKKKKSKK